MAEVASDEQAIEEEEKELIHSIFAFGDTLVREVMVPQPDIVALPAGSTVRQSLEAMLEHGYSRLPVYRGGIDEIQGVAHARDLIRSLLAGSADVPMLL
jgi:CBS domain containing-hemolysin-like protein